MVIEYRKKKQYVEENIHLLGSSQDIPQKNCFKIRNKLYKLYNANQLVLTMHVRERLTNFCTYLLRT